MYSQANSADIAGVTIMIVALTSRDAPVNSTTYHAVIAREMTT
jgi:hypothetical protein